MDNLNLKGVLEALLIAASEPIPTRDLLGIVRKECSRQLTEEELSPKNARSLHNLAKATTADLEQVIHDLNASYEEYKRSFRIINRSHGWKVYTTTNYADFVAQLHPDQKNMKLSKAAVETLSIIAYRQPITKSAIEATRGVSCDAMVQKLINLDLIRIQGRADLPGRPLLYATTNAFTEHFGLKCLQDLPAFGELSTQAIRSSQSELVENVSQMSFEEIQ